MAASLAVVMLAAAWFAVRTAGSALVVASPVAAPDAIVSLASHEWERLPAAASLAGRYPDALVVLTLPQPATEFNCHDCARRVDRLAVLGVDRGRVRIVPLIAGGTFGEALAIGAFARDHGVKSLLVVTSPYHTRRSLATFQAVLQGSGVEIGIVPAKETSPARPDRWWLASYDRAYVAYEWTATFYYRLKHGVPLA